MTRTEGGPRDMRRSPHEGEEGRAGWTPRAGPRRPALRRHGGPRREPARAGPSSRVLCVRAYVLARASIGQSEGKGATATMGASAASLSRRRRRLRGERRDGDGFILFTLSRAQPLRACKCVCACAERRVGRGRASLHPPTHPSPSVTDPHGRDSDLGPATLAPPSAADGLGRPQAACPLFGAAARPARGDSDRPRRFPCG